MFEEYIEELSKRPKVEENPVYYPPPFAFSVTLNPSILVDKLTNLEMVSTNELTDLISNHYNIILNKDFIKNNKVLLARLFTNERFITTFSRVVVCKQLTEDELINCNKLIYDYMVYKNKESNILMILYNLGKAINGVKLSVLRSLGLSEAVSTDLVISRYSTQNQILAMKRLNVAIINSSASVMTEQMIVNIYEKLFDNLTPMFEGIMFDSWDEEDFTDQEQEEIYGTITLAILDILRDAPFNYITSVLTTYAQDHQYLYHDDPVRINLQAIAVSDYGRIIDAVDYVENQLKIHVPCLTKRY